jgi:hypothetical protein
VSPAGICWLLSTVALAVASGIAWRQSLYALPSVVMAVLAVLCFLMAVLS